MHRTFTGVFMSSTHVSVSSNRAKSSSTFTFKIFSFRKDFRPCAMSSSSRGALNHFSRFSFAASPTLFSTDDTKSQNFLGSRRSADLRWYSSRITTGVSM
ncbi:hypothetical protein ATCV1_z269L [Acanthocystis turfacea chlorella virus 1]|uniref:Uncharacterized protein z269L n=1 Tax=Chlorovirus heliozoae TaxID=322019 RepID=A7K8M9_9PHYC|nr:hypothetical protein ATCV1_z269L [Acanthocystis turfacea chlorella virus 1]ABT16403.1 hypothetical protein ATCV1_z269L [Acanthocystis turfacea chlorella virus 1]